MVFDTSEFMKTHTRAVLVTHRKDGGLQASPIRVSIDEHHQILAATRAYNAKALNLQRDSRFALCVVNDEWHGDWLTVEGTAKITGLPNALGDLRSLYRSRGSRLADSDEFESKMQEEQRVFVQFEIERVAGTAISRRRNG